MLEIFQTEKGRNTTQQYTSDIQIIFDIIDLRSLESVGDVS